MTSRQVIRMSRRSLLLRLFPKKSQMAMLILTARTRRWIPLPKCRLWHFICYFANICTTAIGCLAKWSSVKSRLKLQHKWFIPSRLDVMNRNSPDSPLTLSAYTYHATLPLPPALPQRFSSLFNPSWRFSGVRSLRSQEQQSETYRTYVSLEYLCISTYLVYILTYNIISTHFTST